MSIFADIIGRLRREGPGDPYGLPAIPVETNPAADEGDKGSA